MQHDYYKILGIERNATEQEIKQAYRKLAKLYHPDVSKVANAHDKFIEITEAYEFLIEHGQTAEYAEASSDEQKYTAYREREEYINFREEVRKKAEEQARMRYEAFKKQNEAFQKSGINDIGLLFTMAFRVIAIPLTLALFFLPIVLAIGFGDYFLLFLCLLTWIFAGGLGWYIYDNRKHYFMPGKFYFNLNRINQIFTDTRPTKQKCYYCSSKTANSKPYKFELLKLKDIKLKTQGYRQHNINYVNDKSIIQIPRSQKAFIVHTINIFVKVFAIMGCIIFFNSVSLVWRFISGMILGGIISTIILLVTNTKSNKTYIWSLGMIFRICIWMVPIVMGSSFSLHPFHIEASDSIYFIVTCILFLDCFLMQPITFLFGKYSYKPIIRQYKDAEQQFNNGFKLHNDVFVISVIYPLYMWILG